MGVVGIEVEPRGAATPDRGLNSLGVPLASRAMSGLGQGLLSRLLNAPSSPASFRSSWQSQLTSLGTNADSSADSVLGEEQTRTLSASTPSSTLVDETLSAVAGRLGGSAFENPAGSDASPDVSKAWQPAVLSNLPTALLPKGSEDRTRGLTGAVGLQSQTGQSIVSDSARTSPARKSTEDGLKTSPGGDAIPVQSSLVVPSLMVGTLDAPNQGQLNLQTPKRATPQDSLESVRDDYPAKVTPSPASGSTLANPSNLPGRRELEIQAGSELPPLPITRDSSLTTDRVETPTIALEQTVVRAPAAAQAYALGSAEPSVSGREDTNRPFAQTLNSTRNEGTASGLPEAANRYQAGSPASSGFEARAAAPVSRVTWQASAARAQTHGSAPAAINGSAHPDQSGLLQSAADQTGFVDKDPISIGPKVSVLHQSTPDPGYMGSRQGMQAASTTAGDQSAVLTQLSGPSSSLNPEPRLGELNDSQSIVEIPGVMKAGTGKTGKLQFQAAPGGALGVLASATPAAHPTSFTANIPGSDALSLARDPSIVQSANGTAAVVGESSTAAQSTSMTHQTFATIDNVDGGTALNWVHAGSRHAEAGFEDPALGWIGVRADQSGGGVHAIVVPTTAEAAEALGSQMAGLNAHLAESHTSLASLALGSVEGREGGTGADQSFNQSAGQNQAQSNSQDPYVSSAQVMSAGSRVGSAVVSAPTASPVLPDHEGKHISVMA